jgi:ferritin-like metal-binding protein YciE
MESNKLKDLLIEELQDLYSAENQLLKALPKMAKNATSPELKEGFETHLEQTQGHVERLENVLGKLEAKTRGPKCKAMEGLIEEGKEMIEDHDDPEELDVGLICAAQKVEHYEIASYGTVVAWANTLELKDIANELKKTLDEEIATDEKLTELAESSINLEAASAEADE